jgi:hypothetical protein
MSTHQDYEPSQPTAAGTPPPLTVDEKRQVVYSSLLRYGTEAVSLRERALDRAVLGALIGSAADDPFRVGRIRENLHYRPEAPQIRQGAVQESIGRLKGEGKVDQTELRKVNAYFLTPAGAQEVTQVINSSEELFDPVLRGLLRDTAHLCSFDEGAHVFRKFVFECFGRFGQALARNITGHMTHEVFLRIADLEAAFKAAMAGRRLSEETVESLKARCFGFLQSSDPDGERLKFHLAQGYYFTQLLGFENGGFNPLNEHAFSGGILYLDTNVLLHGIVYLDETRELFVEMVQVAKRIGMEVCVTRATVDEARGVAADRMSLLAQIIDVVPEELSERTEDQFIQGFLLGRETNPELTITEFLAPFEHLTNFVEGELHLVIDDRTAEEIIASRDVERLAQTMNDAALRTRGWGKSGGTLGHDIAHYVAIQDIRASGRKAWFLTRDRTLLEAASHLDGDGPPFCFGLIGFLHSISPFMTMVEEQPFADIFADFIKEEAFPVGNIFDAQELAIIAEYHADVIATPPEQVVRAFDYVKSKTLEGRPYRRNDIPDVSLELKKFLASNKEEQMAALRAETERRAAEQERLTLEKAEERRRRKAEEAVAARLRGELAGEKEEVATTKTVLADTKTELADVRTAMSQQEQRFAARQHRARGMGAASGVAAGAIVWGLNDAIVAVLVQKIPALLSWNPYVVMGLNAIGALLFCVPAFYFVHRAKWGHYLKAGLYTVLIVATLVFSRLFTDDAISAMGKYGDAASIVLVLLLALLAISQGGKDD